MDPEPIFGREQLLDELAAGVVDKRVRVLITGPSGVGKSALTRAMVGEIRSEHPDLIAVHHEIASPVVSLDAMLGDCAAQIADQTPLGSLSSGFGRALLRALRDHPFALASAALLDVATHLLPRSTKTLEAAATALTEEISAARPNTTAGQLIAGARRDLLGGMFALLEVLSANGFGGVLTLDAADQASEATRGAVATLLRRAPDGWAVIVSVNDETDQGIAAFNSIWPEAAAARVARVVLDGLDEPAFERWTRAVRGEVPPPEILNRVLVNCGGRPLYLTDWVEKRSDEAEHGPVTSRLGPYYDARLRALPELPRRLVRQLSLLPTGSRFSLSLLAALLETSETEALAVVDDLVASHFIDPPESAQDEPYRFVHEVAHQQVRMSLPHPVEIDAARRLLAVLGHLPGGSLDRRYAKLRLASLAGQESLLLQEGVATAQALVDIGSVRPADEVFRLTLASAQSAKERVQEAEAGLGIAQVLLDMGYYEESLEMLQAVNANVLRRPGRRDLARGQALIRLNLYEAARTALEKACEAFRTSGDEIGALTALREENTILRDLELYEEAVSHARGILKGAEDGPPLLKAACHRALARSLALAGAGGVGLDHARKALLLATEAGSTRAEGNAHLAAGECMRHTRRFEEATAEYRVASTIAETLANRDSFLWAQLGLADTLLLDGRIEEAAEPLAEVSAIVSGTGSRYPLEFLHWNFSRAVLDLVDGTGDFASVERAANEYASLGIDWPRRYVGGLEAEGTVAYPKNL